MPMAASVVDLAKCTSWCSKNYPNAATNCILPAVRGQGPCYVCGPLKTSPTQQLCSGACKDTSTDSKNCGSCGKVVSVLLEQVAFLALVNAQITASSAVVISVLLEQVAFLALVNAQITASSAVVRAKTSLLTIKIAEHVVK
ncbi:hypothetical protein N7462_003082 [Penicillium macrosclerotiorum]|uniref:uncharacterized protein n=1 Tax=Penicillium macrosclerotiorum TaxID=303699 RepID=UPI0025468308|nr:uncharacterized protein N7462_003082 [Penicillium macrosclerotiorum]KAJ5688690.1 hypothetical protein N7462_003082 [Penicillium macrosclerotiorum]